VENQLLLNSRSVPSTPIHESQLVWLVVGTCGGKRDATAQLVINFGRTGQFWYCAVSFGDCGVPIFVCE
jgi:hypothetical protein